MAAQIYSYPLSSIYHLNVCPSLEKDFMTLKSPNKGDGKNALLYKQTYTQTLQPIDLTGPKSGG